MNLPYLHPRVPDGLKWRMLRALLKLNQRPQTQKTRDAILGALGAMNIAAAFGVPEGREELVANLGGGLRKLKGNARDLGRGPPGAHGWDPVNEDL